MSRLLEVTLEEKETRRRDAFVRALDFELPGLLETQGVTLLGFAVKFDAFECLMTLKADIGGDRQVSFVGAGTIIDCVLKATTAARNDRLRWREDIYLNPQT